MKRTTLLILLLPLIFWSCRKDPVLVTKQMTLNSFSTLEIRGELDVYLVQDTVCSITITGVDRVIENTTIVVDTGALTIESRHRGKFLHPREPNTQVIIHVDTLRRININEACHIYTQNALGHAGDEIGVVSSTRLSELDLELACGTFYFWNHPNAVKMNLRGHTDVLKLWIVGLSRIDASNLDADYVICENGASSDCYVKPLQKLEYKISNKGNIYYSGSPAQGVTGEKTATASGQLIQQ